MRPGWTEQTHSRKSDSFYILVIMLLSKDTYKHNSRTVHQTTDPAVHCLFFTLGKPTVDPDM